MSLEFDPVEHRYTIGGREILSVTKVLELAGIIDYSMLPADIREFALARGTAVHIATQYDDQGILSEESLDPELLGYIRAWRKFRYETRWENLFIEYRGYQTVWDYAGTADRIGWFQYSTNTETCVLDIKTGRAPGWVALQLAAYSELVNLKAYGEVLGRVSVELHADGTYRMETFSVADRRRHFADFLACRRVIQLRGEKWI